MQLSRMEIIEKVCPFMFSFQMSFLFIRFYTFNREEVKPISSILLLVSCTIFYLEVILGLHPKTGI